MPDDLDQLIRTAMKTLDAEVPSGYFEALPNQTIARLEGSMQHGSSGTTETRDTVVSPPPMALDSEDAAGSGPHEREQDREDSGLHDIRNLAQSTKQRLSSRRITQSPPVSEDVLASSSGSFKNIALPQPANMVSLPELDELPPVAEVAAADKAAKKAAKEATKDVAVAPTAAVEAPARKAFSLPSQQKKSKGPLFALVGTGLAAAAGAVIYLQMNKSEDKRAAAPAVAQAPAKVEAASAAEAPAPPPAPQPQVTPIEPPPQAAAAQPVEEAKAEDDHKADSKKAAKGGKKIEKDEPKAKVETVQPEKVEAKKPADKKGGGGDEGEPSFDALLKEAGVSEKKEQKPVLDKKALTGDDFKKGMAAVAPKAKGCYTGTQGTATVKLTIAPSGQISKVSVGGDFAGKPEASCIEAAVRSASFPPWDGGPQSFSYPVLLSD